MLQQEGFVVADMSASTPLQRSSWKAEAIRRGDLKISGPIPITEDMPLNDDEEKEYAERGALDSSLQQQGALEEQSQRPETPPRPLQPPPTMAEHMTALRSNPVGMQAQQDEDMRERQPSTSPPKMRHVNQVQRESVAQSTPHTPSTPFRSTPESATKAVQKKKRKSGLRGVFRKMFGRKSRDEAEDHEDEIQYRGHNYHHSDPGMLRSTPPRETKIPTGPRISDLPIQELQPLHPLGQHLPYPMNVNAPPASPPQEYLTFDMQRPDPGRRRATLPTVPSAVAHRRSLDEQRGKLTTWEEIQDDGGEQSPGMIGIAVSSPTQATPKQHRRRSRSADALHQLVKGRASIERRRSAEIRYWRESYMSGSIYSRPQTAKTVETTRSVQVQEPTIRKHEPESFTEMSATLVQADDPDTPTPMAEERPKDHEREREREVQAPVSTFNFGNLKNALFGPSEEDSATEPAMHEELLAPPAPPVRSQSRPLSIEDRVLHLESKYCNLETLTRRISTRNNRHTIILENAPRNLRSRNRSSSASASRSASRGAPSIHQEPMHQSSIDTLNPGPVSISPTLPDIPGGVQDGGMVLQNMYEALEHERTARKALEQQVRNLQHDISDLHALVNKLIASATATSPSYPTPSPDTLVVSTEDQRVSCSTPRAPTHGKRVTVVRNFSSSTKHNSESESEDDGVGKKSYDDVATPDVWATPKEEGFGGSGFFHGEERVSGWA
ncbi:hypothetical protein BDW02DRAFT_142664 [Decorospora gaudefroyi]|uniref:Uncharacterized protein n=1 Tax=Decorospora gaudefroyi TaxID=184978 RepID=A0A6A5K8D8_9PLEO|nr:hypothetical protein BDW02DRAFT_142664 [Decorospora gaudefroyi]